MYWKWSEKVFGDVETSNKRLGRTVSVRSFHCDSLQFRYLFCKLLVQLSYDFHARSFVLQLYTRFARSACERTARYLFESSSLQFPHGKVLLRMWATVYCTYGAFKTLMFHYYCFDVFNLAVKDVTIVFP